MFKAIVLSIAGFAALAASAASAHDFFLLPESFHTRHPGPLIIHATVGSSFPTPEVVVTEDRIDAVWLRGAGQPRVIQAGSDEKSTILHLIGGHGVVVAGVKTKPRDVEYEEDRIPLILAEYRVAPESAAAVDRLPKPRTWLVVSRRFAKTLVCIQECSGWEVAEQPIDGMLEFVTHGSTGDQFLLLAGRRPLGNYPVDLVDSSGKRQHLQTDPGGMVHLPRNAKGKLMLFAAVLTPPGGAERFTLDLSSLSFSR